MLSAPVDVVARARSESLLSSSSQLMNDSLSESTIPKLVSCCYAANALYPTWIAVDRTERALHSAGGTPTSLVPTLALN